MSTIRERELAHSSGIYAKRNLEIVTGKDAEVFDSGGRAYIDCVGGQGVCTLGHCNAAVVQAIADQAARLMVCTEMFANDRRAEFQESLVSVLPNGLNRVFLCNSGAEAVEAALKFARLATGRTNVVSTVRGFHGRTFGALSATQEPKYRDSFVPLVPGFSHVAFNNIEALDQAIGDETAAVIIEPLQGEGGVHPATLEFLQAARKLTLERGAMLITDEIQCGFGRTGRWFCGDYAGIEPDLLTMAKAIAGGFPMGAVGIGPRVTGLAPGLHGTTFGGNPLACAAGTASISEMKRLDIPGQAKQKGEWFIDRLKSIESPLIREVRGRGLLVGIDLKVKVAPILRKLEERGVLALPAGLTVLRFLPPAVISQEQLETVAAAVESVLSQEAVNG